MSQIEISRRDVLKLFGAGAVGTALSGLVGYTYAFQIEPRWLAIERLVLTLDTLPESPDPFSLVCLSDFHHEPGAGLAYPERVVQAVNALQPDAICLLGDYVFSDASAIQALAGVLSNLAAPLGVFAILGNHDYWTDPETVRAGLRLAGIEVLINGGALLERAGMKIYLAGLDDGWSGTPDTEAALQDAPSDAPVIMLMHEPDFSDEIATNNQIVLQLSGHSHGGQVKPLFLDAPIRPAYARNYIAGLYTVEDMYLYVTRGVGVIPPRARFNCRPEITQITLTAAGN